ncbi:juxtaposed with another zinc finger protein 1 isoform X1 [Piliocolobus tephrosceles]|uniref:JAZF zinc finger 1 n=1 Tax=Piliocolobus tephrosceles TaxID=591936 RepID=A0A8C9LQD8_9PRIM|nr:juxtaposed with another zinc finger protein 1 isoform X1 [Piliocolobus tephrosceles]
MTGIAAASFFSNTCRFGGCGLHFPTLADLIEHIEDNHIDTDPRVLEKQELQQPTYVALSYINRFMTDAARREQESLKKKIQPKLSLTLSSSVSRGNVSTPPRHSSGSLTPPVTPPITPSSSFRSSTPTGSEYDEEEVDYEESDSDESWTTESAISSEAILSSMCMNGGEEKPFACPVPGCKKRYKKCKTEQYPAPQGSSGVLCTVTVSSTETDPDRVPFSNTEKLLMMRECSQSNIKWKKGIERLLTQLCNSRYN